MYLLCNFITSYEIHTVLTHTSKPMFSSVPPLCTQCCYQQQIVFIILEEWIELYLPMKIFIDALSYLKIVTSLMHTRYIWSLIFCCFCCLCPVSCTIMEIAPSTHWTRDWMGPKTVWMLWNFSCWCKESNFGLPVYSLSLYQKN